VKIPLQAHFATVTTGATPALVDGLEKALKAAGKDAEIFRYEADHAFVTSSAPRSTTARPPNSPGAAPRRSSRNIWGEARLSGNVS